MSVFTVDSSLAEASNITPASGELASPFHAISFEVTGDVYVFVAIKTGAIEQVVFDGSVFTQQYELNSTTSESGGVSTFNLIKSDGWPDDFVLKIGVAGAGGGGGGETDHGSLTGLADDDHTQYLLADGTRDAEALNIDGNLGVAVIRNSTAIGASDDIQIEPEGDIIFNYEPSIDNANYCLAIDSSTGKLIRVAKQKSLQSFSWSAIVQAQTTTENWLGQNNYDRGEYADNLYDHHAQWGSGTLPATSSMFSQFGFMIPSGAVLKDLHLNGRFSSGDANVDSVQIVIVENTEDYTGAVPPLTVDPVVILNTTMDCSSGRTRRRSRSFSLSDYTKQTHDGLRFYFRLLKSAGGDPTFSGSVFFRLEFMVTYEI